MIKGSLWVLDSWIKAGCHSVQEPVILDVTIWRGEHDIYIQSKWKSGLLWKALLGLKQVGSNSAWGGDLRNPREVNGKPPDRATIWTAEQKIVKSFWQVRMAAECWGTSGPFRALATATFFFFMNVSGWPGHCFTLIDINDPLSQHQAAAAVYKPSMLLIEGPLVVVRLNLKKPAEITECLFLCRVKNKKHQCSK